MTAKVLSDGLIHQLSGADMETWRLPRSEDLDGVSSPDMFYDLPIHCTNMIDKVYFLCYSLIHLTN